MIHHIDIGRTKLKSWIKQKLINFGGNRTFKIYGTLQCSSGKRMLLKNRVFFFSEEDAIKNGYRPCGHCMKAAYKKWKDGIIRN
ncbi:Ada metal-binding domain-containing protein [Flavihumibacter fluvii]|uniref:Ada metal-binding domain-containing protein n=1 Tax=Flavihumibacter fluvii TaxID=2838157 RepID=UPI001BDF6F6F|nr:Ada metal-binding domain-containing protein [Flavihumibacter fluvii]ULQ54683.1 metal-binding protein [Flavihumibacter fluvii]